MSRRHQRTSLAAPIGSSERQADNVRNSRTVELRPDVQQAPDSEIIQTILHPKPVKDIKKICENLIDSLSGCFIQEPVTTVDGDLHEKEKIEEWFVEEKTSPVTREVLESKQITPSILAKKQIAGLVEKHPLLKDCREWYLPKKWIAELQQACQSGDEKAIKGLIIRDRRLLVHPLDEAKYFNQTALHFAAGGNPKALDTIVQLLETRQKGLTLAVLLQPDSQGCLPIHRALLAQQEPATLLKISEYMGKHLDTVIKLPPIWPEGFDFRIVNTALRLCIFPRDFSKINFFLRLGADPKSLHPTVLRERDAEGNSALHLAAQAGSTSVVALLTAGVSEVLQNKAGRTARELASNQEHENTVAQLDQTVAQLQVAEDEALRGSGILGIFLLKQQQIIQNQQLQIQELTEKNKNLHYELAQFHHRSQQAIKPLAELQAKFFTGQREWALTSVVDKEIAAVLKFQDELVTACEEGDSKTVRLLLKNGAKPDAANAKSIQPLGAAVWGMNLEVINVLLEAMGGASPMTWEACEGHNINHYKEVFMISSFDPKTYSDWYALLEKMKQNGFVNREREAIIPPDGSILPPLPYRHRYSDGSYDHHPITDPHPITTVTSRIVTRPKHVWIGGIARDLGETQQVEEQRPNPTPYLARIEARFASLKAEITKKIESAPRARVVKTF